MLTDVDALLSLLEKRKKVSMHNAAKELNTKVSTIEKWSTVLEEEGLVNIKYSLTTPYLELKQVAKTKHTDLFVGEQELPEPSSQGLQQPEQEQKTKKTEISANQDIEFLIKQVRDYITQGNFLQAQQKRKLLTRW